MKRETVRIALQVIGSVCLQLGDALKELDTIEENPKDQLPAESKSGKKKPIPVDDQNSQPKGKVI